MFPTLLRATAASPVVDAPPTLPSVWVCAGRSRATQDFLQILSMFSNMEFAWPSALLSLYRGLSLVNFNLELLAPECSFAVNFEQKWFVTQLLPLILGASILLVLAATKALQWIQRVLFKVLPFGATMDTSLVDACIGIFITGVYHLYLCELAISIACLLCS